jgi:uncharacterized protein YecE (DUF72 family)
MWANKAWTGILYPPRTPQHAYLRLYAQSFNTIELNTTHYRIPAPETVESWRVQAAPGFHFCPKIPQTISHYRKLINCREDIETFASVISLFEEKMGCAFVQLHESFGLAYLENLISFLNVWPRHIPLAVEFRHTEWFEHHTLRPEVAHLLTEYGCGTVITDVAGRRDVLHTSLTSPVAMIRFVGNGLHPTDFERADAWIGRLAQWAEQGVQRVYLLVHQPDDAAAPEMGIYLIRQLNARLGLNLRIPGLPAAEQGQMSLF